MQARVVVILSLSLLLACGKDKDKDKEKESSSSPAQIATASIDAGLPALPPAKEHLGGMERFKEPGVYVDGVATAVLRFGELPVTLKPVWVEERASVPFKKGDKGPTFRIEKKRRYRFSEYFRELGIDLATIKELHLYGGNQKAAAVVIPGKSLRESDGFLFRFGGAIWGKPLPVCPADVGDGKCPDQISTLAVYINKEPPKREGGHFYFEGERVDGIPYLGTPVRGGVRVYLDGTIAARIKRNKLAASDLKTTGTTGNEEYSFFEFLTSQGVDTNKVQEAWIIEYERRTKKFSRDELLKLRFRAGAGGSGEVLIGPNAVPAQVISLHSKALSPEELPQITKKEIEMADG
tara:strand:+ start:49992 stop:51041 length:1050 start_codon:yes stop_codon:yes gene_type:complete